MSSATPKGQSGPVADHKPKSSLPPVAIFDTPVSKAISLGRPAVLLAGCFIRLPALIEDPVSTLRTALPLVAAIQIVYAISCLPVAGSQQAKSSRKPRPGERRKQDASARNVVGTTIISLLLTTIATLPLHLLFVLFGAPFLDHAPHTFLCAAHLAVLAVFPVFYSRGVDAQAMLAIAGAYAPLDEVFGGALGAVLGAWLGAVPIPLDWDREWQKWPVTIVVGLYMGYVLGSKGLGTVFYGKTLGSAGAKEATE
ncbi:Glycosylphosphatidylinositol (GPI) anchor assembly protein [Amphichorda felina]